MNERELAWAYLSRVVEPPCVPLVDFLAKRDVVEAARLIAEDRLPSAQARLRELTSARRECDFARRDLMVMAELGGRLITPDSPDWPAWQMLAFTRAQVDEGLGCIFAPPVALWALGASRLAPTVEVSCAVVGTRAASGYGERVAGGWSAELAEAGLTVISGGAYGVDAAAHRGALSADGTTITILACGVDVPYPSGHAGLFRRIADRGIVLSEYPPSTRPAKHRFLARNRLVAGLSSGVLVVEAGNRSGALNTAGWARRLGLPLFALPGPVDALASAGCHRLIAEGAAELAMSAGALLERIGPLGLFADDQPDCRRELDDLSPDEAKAHNALVAKRAHSVVTISRSSGLAMASTLAALALLELRGLAIRDAEGGWLRCGKP